MAAMAREELPMNDYETRIKRRLVITGAVGVLVLLAVGIGVLGTWYCDTTNVPAGGPTPVPAGALCLSGTPGGVVACPWAPGVPPVGTNCTAGAGNTCNTPGAKCQIGFGTCKDTYHLTTGQCNCRCN
jgi:hypothetical protein